METKSLEKIAKILKSHKGSSNAITSREIAESLGIYEDDTHSLTRAAIKESIIKYSLPVVASSAGYYTISSADEMSEYEENLLARIKGITDRLAWVRASYELAK